ncbi:MAG: DNA polymerase ligase N-terminal domain-containing protein, partial [Chromatiales bacterium]
GVIPPGQYGAGEVIVWDCGVYSPDEGGQTWFHDRTQAERQVRAGMERGKLSIELRGEKLKGSFALVRTKDQKSWLLIKHKDRFTSQDDVTHKNRSVLSGVAVEDHKVVPAHRIPAGAPRPGRRGRGDAGKARADARGSRRPTVFRRH